MSTCATYDDVNLILRLYEMRREKRLREARAWFTANFKPATMTDVDKLCPPGSEGNASYRMVATYWEMVASFITSGVLQPEIFFESGRELLVVWIRIEPVLAEMREMRKDPSALANLEEVAGLYESWLEQKAPGAYAAFRERIS